MVCALNKFPSEQACININNSSMCCLRVCGSMFLFKSEASRERAIQYKIQTNISARNQSCLSVDERKEKNGKRFSHKIKKNKKHLCCNTRNQTANKQIYLLGISLVFQLMREKRKMENGSLTKSKKTRNICDATLQTISKQTNISARNPSGFSVDERKEKKIRKRFSQTFTN